MFRILGFTISCVLL